LLKAEGEKLKAKGLMPKAKKMKSNGKDFNNIGCMKKKDRSLQL
jgi:hypothetical protein